MLSIGLNCNYVMFGSSESKANHLKITSKDIEICYLSPNEDNYKVLIDFKDIIEFKFCRHFSVSGICLKTDRQSMDQIISQLFLSNEVINTFKFDSNSSDMSDHYIIAILKDQMSDEVMDQMKNWCSHYKRLNCVEITAEDMKNRLQLILNRINGTLVMHRNQSAVESSTGSNNSKVGTEVESQVIASEEINDFSFKPIDVMFGTFEISVNEMILSSNGIQFIDICEDINESKVKNHLSIDFKFVDKITYDFQSSVICLIIHTIYSFSLKVNQFLRTKSNDQKRLFDSTSLDFRENFLIIRFVVKCVDSFLKFLIDIKIDNKELLLEESTGSYVDVIYRSTKSQIQNIENDFKIKELEKELRVSRNECNVWMTECKGLKRKCNELEENEMICAICLERKQQIVAKHMKIVSTVCGHIFCDQCLRRSLQTRNVCPICVRSFQRPRKTPYFPVFHEIHI